MGAAALEFGQVAIEVLDPVPVSGEQRGVLLLDQGEKLSQRALEFSLLPQCLGLTSLDRPHHPGQDGALRRGGHRFERGRAGWTRSKARG